MIVSVAERKHWIGNPLSVAICPKRRLLSTLEKTKHFGKLYRSLHRLTLPLWYLEDCLADNQNPLSIWAIYLQRRIDLDDLALIISRVMRELRVEPVVTINISKILHLIAVAMCRLFQKLDCSPYPLVDYFLSGPSFGYWILTCRNQLTL